MRSLTEASRPLHKAGSVGIRKPFSFILPDSCIAYVTFFREPWKPKKAFVGQTNLVLPPTPCFYHLSFKDLDLTTAASNNQRIRIFGGVGEVIE